MLIGGANQSANVFSRPSSGKLNKLAYQATAYIITKHTLHQYQTLSFIKGRTNNLENKFAYPEHQHYFFVNIEQKKGNSVFGGNVRLLPGHQHNFILSLAQCPARNLPRRQFYSNKQNQTMKLSFLPEENLIEINQVLTNAFIFTCIFRANQML